MDKRSEQQGKWSSFWSSKMAAFFPSINSSATWDREYTSGEWERLDADSELGRYAIVFAHVCRQSAKPSVLDIGCGPGRLLKMIARIDYDAYVGLDVSAEAVQRAQALGQERSAFSVGFAEEYENDRRFGVIVFNEVLYYLKQPVEQLVRFHGMLDDDGVLVISMFDCPPARSVWRKLKKRFDTVHAARVTNQLKHTWDVRVLQLRK